jgi:hypothetical protein
MADDTAAFPADDGAGGGAGGGGGQPWWRMPVITTMVALPLLAGAGGARLGCEAGVLDMPVCANDAAVAQAQPDAEIEAGQTTVTVTDPGGAPVQVAQEPTSLFPGQFLKFVVVAPDASRTAYVTATSLGMTDANMWGVPRGQPKALMKSLGDSFWVAKPVWCQRQPGEPGRIAYVMKGPTGPDLTGLELWVINGDGRVRTRSLLRQ